MPEPLEPLAVTLSVVGDTDDPLCDSVALGLRDESDPEGELPGSAVGVVVRLPDVVEEAPSVLLDLEVGSPEPEPLLLLDVAPCPGLETEVCECGSVDVVEPLLFDVELAEPDDSP